MRVPSGTEQPPASEVIQAASAAGSFRLSCFLPCALAVDLNQSELLALLSVLLPDEPAPSTSPTWETPHMECQLLTLPWSNLC